MELGSGTPLLWGVFLAIVVLLLALDLGVFHRKAHEVSSREAGTWTVVWVALALLFNAYIWWAMGAQKGLEFLTGYLIEKSLSVDNLFVMVLVFTSFGIPKIYQHRVLFWGIFGALVMRGVLILIGSQLIDRFHFIIYVFGAFLVYTGGRMLFAGEEDPDPQKNTALRLFRRFVPTTDRYHGQKFFIVENGKRLATPLLAALVVIEAMDLVFAVDSIPAIFAVTLDPFIVFTSNIFAILGLRALYFLLANVVEKFVHLKVGLAVILAYVGVKMLLSGWYKIPVYVSLGIILGVLLTSILTSIFASRREALLEKASEREHQQ
ncbi:TerC family protein [Vulgatibacter sp.]|uniref:TerC family protein n=1 Tax=Vulgatibacter sp. TaxID=1971226 RepID=UPI0035690210